MTTEPNPQQPRPSAHPALPGEPRRRDQTASPSTSMLAEAEKDPERHAHLRGARRSRGGPRQRLAREARGGRHRAAGARPEPAGPHDGRGSRAASAPVRSCRWFAAWRPAPTAPTWRRARRPGDRARRTPAPQDDVAAWSAAPTSAQRIEPSEAIAQIARRGTAAAAAAPSARASLASATASSPTPRSSWASPARRRRAMLCCWPASPASSPAPSRWPSASTSRCEPSGSCSSARSSSSAKSWQRLPRRRCARLTLIYQAKGLRRTRGRADCAAQLMENPDVALNTLVGRSWDSIRLSLGSPWGAAISSFLAFAVGAVVPVIPFFFAPANEEIATGYVIASAALALIALFGVGAALSLFTGRSALWSGFRQARPRRRRRRPHLRHRARHRRLHRRLDASYSCTDQSGAVPVTPSASSAAISSSDSPSSSPNTQRLCSPNDWRRQADVRRRLAHPPVRPSISHSPAIACDTASKNSRARRCSSANTSCTVSTGIAGTPAACSASAAASLLLRPRPRAR